jgi:predicted ATPase
MRKVASDSINSTLQNTFIQEAISDITDALGGKLEYNAKERRFDFIKKEFSEGTNLSINNAASGEKVLGIFQKLAKNGMFSPSKITILDEPENHLHPQWLMTLAEVLVKLVKSGCPIMIASHSPDFLQALRFYSKKYKLEQAKFYLADNGIIMDKTGKEYEIFDNLATPTNKIFHSVVEESLKNI